MTVLHLVPSTGTQQAHQNFACHCDLNFDSYKLTRNCQNFSSSYFLRKKVLNLSTHILSLFTGSKKKYALAIQSNVNSSTMVSSLTYDFITFKIVLI